MPLPDVAQGDPHVAAHNNERHLLNDIQTLTDETFVEELLASYGGSRVPIAPRSPGDGENINQISKDLIATIKASLRDPFGGTPGTAYRGTQTIYLDAGDYTITEARALLGSEGLAHQATGLRIVGAGRELTRILFNPASPGELLYNDWWRNVKIEGVTFVAQTTGCTFMKTDTTHAAQQYIFNDVGWMGPWFYGFDLQGNNNNSEYSFRDCESYFHDDAGTFFYIGASNTSEEFLNYWFNEFKFWSTSASFLDVAKGGHITIKNFDASDWGVNLDARKKLFNLRGSVSQAGVKHFKVDGMRTEIKNALGGVLFSEWGRGIVRLTDVDMSSHQSTYTYGDVIEISYDALAGPVYLIEGGSYAGKIRVSYTEAGKAISNHKIKVRDLEWRQRTYASSAVEYNPDGTVTSFVTPQVTFENISSENTNAASAPGITVWDCTVGRTHGDPGKPLIYRRFELAGFANSLYENGSHFWVALPVGAIITGLRVLFPGLRSSSTAQGTWTVTTHDSQVLLNKQVGRRQKDGYDEFLALAAPWSVGNTEEAQVDIQVTGLTASDTTRDCIVAIEGYW